MEEKKELAGQIFAFPAPPLNSSTLSLSETQKYVLDGSRYEFHVKKLVPDAMIPTKAHNSDLGYDLYAAQGYTLIPHSRQLISTGICCKFPSGFGAILKDRSSVASKQGLFVHAGVIDPNYRNEILVLLYNSTDETVTISKGTKIAQMILTPLIIVQGGIKEVADMDTNTDRGLKGFGSSGK